MHYSIYQYIPQATRHSRLKQTYPYIPSLQELGAFVKGMTPEMIECVIKYVDCDGNGEIDIAELDLAFRLSRIEIDDCFEGQPPSGGRHPPTRCTYQVQQLVSLSDLGLSVCCLAWSSPRG